MIQILELLEGDSMANVCRLMTEGEWLMTEGEWPNGCITAMLGLLGLVAQRRNGLQHADEVRKQDSTLHAVLDRALYLRLY